MQRWVVSAIAVFSAVALIAQSDFSNRGKEFYLTFLPNYHNKLRDWDTLVRIYLPGDSLILFFSGAEQQTRIWIDATDFWGTTLQLMVILQPGEVHRLAFSPRRYELRGDNWDDLPYLNSQNQRIVRTGFHITADNDISVVAVNRAQWTTDACLVYPKKVLGTEYIVLSYPSDGRTFQDVLEGSSTPSQFAVVATEPRTQVVIEPSIPSMKRQEITLDAGEVFLVQADMNWSLTADLTGTRIRSDKPIAVFAGHQRATIPLSLRNEFNMPSRDMLFSQLLPVSAWGVEALLFPFPDPPGIQSGGEDVYRVVAARDNTRLYIDGTFAATLRAGQVFEAALTHPVHLRATKPIQVAQFKSTASINGSASPASDPFFLISPDPLLFDRSYFVIVPQLYEWDDPTPDPVMEDFYITIVKPMDLQAIHFEPADVTPIGAAEPIGDSDYEYVTYRVNPGVYRIWAEQPFGVYVYAYGQVESYGYVGGGQVLDLIDVYPPQITTKAMCFGVQGTVADTGLIRSGIATVAAQSGYCSNVALTTQTISRDTVTFTAVLENPFQDGRCYVMAADSAGRVTQWMLEIPGMTVHLDSSLTVDTVVAAQWYVPGQQLACYPFPLVNYGRFPQTIDSIRLRHFDTLFGVPDAAVTLEPGQQRVFQLCVRQPITVPMAVRDTLDIYQPCGVRRILALNIDVQVDTAAPAITTTADPCDTALTVQVVDPPPYRSGIATYEIVTLENLELRDVNWRGKDTVQWSFRVLDPYRDAIFALWVQDSSGNRQEVSDTIQGFTLQWRTQSLPDTLTSLIGERRCFEVWVENTGLLPFILDQNVWAESRRWLTIPRSQFPIRIDPGEQKAIVVCAAAFQDTIILDRLVLQFRCWEKTFPLWIQGQEIVQLEQNRCGLTLRLRATTISPPAFSLGKPYPMPATGEVVLPLTSPEVDEYTVALYTAFGRRVARFVFRLEAGFYELRLDLSALPSGTYFGMVQRSNGSIHRFQVQRVQ